MNKLEKKALALLPKWEDKEKKLFKNKEFALNSLKDEVEEFNRTGEINYLLDVVKNILEYSDISIAEIQKNTGLSRPTIYSLKNRENTPKVDTLFLVLKELGYKVSLEPIKIK